jgi:hypothetical protein
MSIQTFAFIGRVICSRFKVEDDFRGDTSLARCRNLYLLSVNSGTMAPFVMYEAFTANIRLTFGLCLPVKTE